MGKTVFLICLGFIIFDFCWYLYLKKIKKQDFKNYFDYMKDPFKFSKKEKLNK